MVEETPFEKWWKTNHEWRRNLFTPEQMSPYQLAKEAWDNALLQAVDKITKPKPRASEIIHTTEIKFGCGIALLGLIVLILLVFLFSLLETL